MRLEGGARWEEVQGWRLLHLFLEESIRLYISSGVPHEVCRMATAKCWRARTRTIRGASTAQNSSAASGLDFIYYG